MSQAASTQRRTYGPAGRRRRAELMEAAVLLAAAQGFTRTRVSDIVGKVGVGQGVFYWYFESKDALFREILHDTTRRLRLFQGGFIAGEDDPLRRIAKGIVATLEFVVHNRYAFALLDHAELEARWRRRRTEAGRVHTVDTVRHLEQAMAEGRIPPGDATGMAEAVSGVVDRLARDMLAGGRKPSAEQLTAVTQQAVDFCLGGITGARSMVVGELRPATLDRRLREIRDRVGSAEGLRPR